MTRQPIAAVSVLAVTLIAAAPARAGLLEDAASDLGPFVDSVVQWQRNDPGAPSKRQVKPEDCTAAVKRWRGRGVKDDDVLLDHSFKHHPKARMVMVKTMEIPGIAFSDMPGICTEFEQGWKAQGFASSLAEFAAKLHWIGLVKGAETSLYQINEVADKWNGEACDKAVAKADAAGPGLRVKTKDAILTTAEFAAQICKPLSTEVPDWVAAGRKSHRAAREKAVAPYAAAGIGGKKLDLIADYEGVYWRLAGGEKTDNPKKLAAAKVLFHWLEGPSSFGIVSHTVRRYEFKGNDLVKVTEKTYATASGGSVPSSAFK